MSEARPERVLVVDDNRDWADSLSRLLRDEGYSVHTAGHPSSTRPVLVAITAWSEESHKAKAKLVFAKNPPQAFFSRLCV